ncbi:LuxR C-terminal-related transcriptional regulator [Aquihabitans sp. McL0605]|uniref:LuxR C-terminal-related transcriptional regulator n=1 Tax=Aquihabitans sp. McL0605 TaxID=3415671 RepID=UPI003CEACDED
MAATPEGPDATDPLADARALLARCDWPAAFAAGSQRLGTAQEEQFEAERLDLLAEASWWLGRLDECISLREAAYRSFEDRGDRRAAGQCAVWLYEHHAFKARPSIAGAWLRRARRALEDEQESVEYGSLVLREAEVTHGRGELATAAGAAADTVALGRRLRSADIEAEALQTLGRIRIDEGLAVEGLELMDEAMLFAVEGRLRPYSTGKVYCSLISACEALGDLRRAGEWSEATSRWAEDHPMAVFPGLCRVHVASSLRARGEWDRAEEEARRACDELADLNVMNAAAGHAEIGEIRRRMGDLVGAEQAFAEAEAISGRAQPGLALVRLAQGRVIEALSMITHAVGEITWNRLARAQLLPALVEIAVAADDLPTARAAVEELQSVGVDFSSPSIAAAALTAEGRVELASGEVCACATLRTAAERWNELGIPHESATARMLQGAACREAGDLDGATASFEAARDRLEHLGAALDLRHLHDITGTAPPLPAGLTEREAEVLRLVAEGLTNKQMAQRLHLSEKTVSRHLSNIFTKIDVTSRSAATAYAFAHDLVL